MVMEIFVSTVAAVIVGNLSCLIFVYGVWRAVKAEKEGAKHGLDRVPVALRVLMIVAVTPILFAALWLH
jgi:hypothetical protein